MCVPFTAVTDLRIKQQYAVSTFLCVYLPPVHIVDSLLT